MTGPDRPVSESSSSLDAALDLLVYAPVGLMLTAAEEIPKLAAKGRTQLGGQLSMARAIGEFAVARGRIELTRRFSGLSGASADVDTPTGNPTGANPEPADLGSEGLLVADEQGGHVAGQPAGPAGDHRPVRANATTSSAGGGEMSTGSDAATAPDRRPSAEDLAIPGYDSLAASQVVQRLAGLSAAELAAVGAYESAHRGRRTILTRVRQLQGS